MKQTRIKTLRRIENGRLAYYRQSADAAFWDDHWEPNLNEGYYLAAKEGHTGYAEWDKIIARYLPRQGRIIEAGCGIGQVVLALEVLGYNVEGVEYAEKTVKSVNERFPDLPVRLGDVTALDVPDGYYTGYLSFGVIEHRYEGPEPFLEEAFRILAPDGIALISVPWFNPLRRFKAAMGFFRNQTARSNFYQYAYPRDMLTKYLTAAGFEVIGFQGTSLVKGLKDEIPGIGWLLKRDRFSYYLRRIIMRLGFLTELAGHMTIVICRKSEAR